MNQANDACGVSNAATRKYLTQCRMWYFPPADAMEKMAVWCTEHGLKTARPYFSLDGHRPLDLAQWNKLRSKWHHAHGMTNVWQEPPVHGKERLKQGGSYLHANQKPLALMERQILACTDVGDVVWEPFGGLCSGAIAASALGRRAFAAEVNARFFNAAVSRIKESHALVKRKVA